MKTTLTKLQQQLYRFTSPTAIRPELNAVLFDGVRAVATDSFCLVETTKLKTTNEAIPDTLITRDSLKAIKVLKADEYVDVETVNKKLLAIPSSKQNGSYELTTDSPDRYPNYKLIKKDAETREYIDVILDGEMLARVAEYLSQFQTGRNARKIKMRVPVKPLLPLILEARSDTESGYAIVMPCHNK